MKRKLPTIQGIQVLVNAIEKIQLFDSQLTPVHADLCQLCLCSKLFNPAIRFLDIDITEIAATEVRNENCHRNGFLNLIFLFCRTTAKTPNIFFYTITMAV